MRRYVTTLVTLAAFLLTLLLPRGVLAEQPAAPAPPPQPPPPAVAAPTAAAPVAPAPPPRDQALAQAQAHFQQGKAAFQARDYVNAIREFKAAQALKYSPKLDYNIAMAYEQLGRPHASAKYYRSYLAGLPDAANRAEVEQKIAQLEAQAAQMKEARDEAVAAAPPAAAPPAVQQPAPYQYAGTAYVPPPPPPPPARRAVPWWIVFPIVGGAMILTAVIVAVALTAPVYEQPAGRAALSQPSSMGTGNGSGLTLFRF